MRKLDTGFTLLEILIVLVVLGVVAAIAFPVLTEQTRRARAQEAVHELGTLKEKMVHYFQIDGQGSYDDASLAEADPGYIGLNPNNIAAGQSSLFTYTLIAAGNTWTARATETAEPTSWIEMDETGTLCGENFYANFYTSCGGGTGTGTSTDTNTGTGSGSDTNTNTNTNTNTGTGGGATLGGVSFTSEQQTAADALLALYNALLTYTGSFPIDSASALGVDISALTSAGYSVSIYANESFYYLGVYGPTYSTDGMHFLEIDTYSESAGGYMQWGTDYENRTTGIISPP